ncbi:MAG TPA: CopG family transcriptional regulator [Candidatus Sulfotelmatobacter sp.]|nr:CopG family transcriptional regulator [Candidatus Sulfotelmatobacter sp.]
MRTTLTLDDDVAALLKKEARKSGEPFKQVVNATLRRGLTAAKKPARKPFKVKPWNLQLPPFEKVEELLEHLEGPDYR